MGETIENPILNSPYEQPDRHYVIGPYGPTGDIKDGRRPSESFIPIAVAKKGRGKATEQVAFDFDATGERREQNSLINELRWEVEKWRRGGHYDGVTPVSRKLLQHWADPTRENRVLFCQREAAETAIYLAEVAGRKGVTDWRRRLEPENAAHNSGLPRVALKMATGSGKTVVMAMLIAWQTLNKAQSPNDSRFTNRFLIVTPGITIRDRLRVLLPQDPQNYYDLRDLVPPDLVGGLERARIVITNYHAFQLKDAKEIQGVARNTRLLLKGDRKDDPFKESPQAMVSRVLRDLGAGGRGIPQVMVLNDEAHHCYQDKIVTTEQKLSAEERDANEEARVWFRGLQAVAAHAGIKQIYDLSATPYYLSGSGYNEGHIFPWTVSDFSLMDAIESGVVKVPRVPVDDDATDELVTYLRLWDFVGDQLPKKRRPPGDWWPPDELAGALTSLHRSYQRAFQHWESSLQQYGETPPVFIVVCPNTVVSKLVYEWIAGGPVEQDAETPAFREGNLELLSNVVDGKPLARPRTVLIDSAQIESGESLKGDFKEAAAAEIAAFKAEYRQRNPGADVDKITDEDLLREVMNTVGKRGRLGEQVRCVVSVSMLTEGWDANTVTHILGLRAFRSQLLCEQVVGRGLRRRSYAVNEDGYFEPEYANVYGIPFQFISSDRPVADPKPPNPVTVVEAVEGREHLRITFPVLDGYRIEVPDEQLWLDTEHAPAFEIGPGTVPRRVEVGGVIGESEHDVADHEHHRSQEVAFALANGVLRRHVNHEDDRRPWLFPQLLRLTRQWLDQCVRCAPGYDVGSLLVANESQAKAVEAIWHAIVRQLGNRRERVRPIFNRDNPTRSTGEVSFATRKPTETTEHSEVSHVTLDGKDGNTWEQLLAAQLENNRAVYSYVKNDHLGFTIPYVHAGRSHAYWPDFLVRLKSRPEDVERTLIIEVSGSRKSPGPTQAKAHTARDAWCVAVNNDGRFGRWGYIEMTDPNSFKPDLAQAIELLYEDAAIIGDPDLLDFADRDVDARVQTRRNARGA